MPKGHIEAGETPAAAALREVWEETGIRAAIESPLETITYRFLTSRTQVHKQVAFFLARYRAGSPAHHNHEVEAVSFPPLRGLEQRLSYPGERRIIGSVRALLRDG